MKLRLRKILYFYLMHLLVACLTSASWATSFATFSPVLMAPPANILLLILRKGSITRLNSVPSIRCQDRVLIVSGLQQTLAYCD